MKWLLAAAVVGVYAGCGGDEFVGDEGGQPAGAGGASAVGGASGSGGSAGGSTGGSAPAGGSSGASPGGSGGSGGSSESGGSGGSSESGGSAGSAGAAAGQGGSSGNSGSGQGGSSGKGGGEGGASGQAGSGAGGASGQVGAGAGGASGQAGTGAGGASGQAGSGGVVCGAGTKACEGTCVAVDDKNFGCTPTSCAPCPGGQICQSGACSVPCDAPKAVCGGQCVDVSSDKKNCGGCGHDCLGGECSGAVCQPVVLATNVGKVRDLAVSGGSVYFVNPDLFAVMRATPGQAGAVQISPANKQSQVSGVAADASWVYFPTFDDGLVSRVPTTAAGVVNPDVLAKGESSAVGIAVSGAGLFWTRTASDGSVRRLDLGGSNVSDVATKQNRPDAIAVTATSVYWTNQGTPQAFNDGEVVMASLASDAAPTLLVAGLHLPSGIDADDKAVCFTQFYGGSVGLVDVASKQTLATISGQGGPARIKMDAANMYWTNLVTGEVMRAPRPPAQGNAAPIAKIGHPWGLALDSKAVYFATDANGGSVLMIAK